MSGAEGFLGDEKRRRVELEAQVLRRQPVVVLDQAEVDVVAVVLKGDEHVDDAQVVPERDGNALFVEERALAAERGAEPDLEAEAAGELPELPQVVRPGLAEIQAVDDDRLGPEV